MINKNISLILRLLFFAFVLKAASSNAIADEAYPDTLTIIDIASHDAFDIPKGWNHVQPRANRAFTNYSIEERSSKKYLRALSSGTASWLEYDIGGLDPAIYQVMEWEWLVNQFPETKWEMNKNNDDFAIRIELVYDLKGSKWNIINLARKGFITSLFRKYPPALVVSYVWSLNVPAGKSYISPTSKNTVVIPIESDVAMLGRWVREQRRINEDYRSFTDKKARLVLKKIRILADSESTPTISESGLTYIRFIKSSEEATP